MLVSTSDDSLGPSSHAATAAAATTAATNVDGPFRSEPTPISLRRLSQPTAYTGILSQPHEPLCGVRSRNAATSRPGAVPRTPSIPWLRRNTRLSGSTANGAGLSRNGPNGADIPGAGAHGARIPRAAAAANGPPTGLWWVPGRGVPWAAAAAATPGVRGWAANGTSAVAREPYPRGFQRLVKALFGVVLIGRQVEMHAGVGLGLKSTAARLSEYIHIFFRTGGT